MGNKKRSDSPVTALSKKLSWALRYGINELELDVNPSGYVYVDALLRARPFTHVSVSDIHRVINQNGNQRFGFAEENGRLMIRAKQAHSAKGLETERVLRALESPVRAFHATVKAALWSIQKRGLYRMARKHIHLALGTLGGGGAISGLRVNCSVFIEIDVAKAMADNIRFFLTEDGVLLTSGVHGFLAPKYFAQVLLHAQPVELQRVPLELDYILVLDFEANATNAGKLPCQEIIEFPVSAVNTQSGEVDAVFHHYVRPEVVPQLTEFIKALTGITQTMVDSGILLHEVLGLFHEFLRETGICHKNWVFLSCGDWDLRTCLANELAYKQIRREEYFCYWLNIKKFMPQQPRGMLECLEALEIPHSGRHHSGIDDTQNIAQCVHALLKAGARVFEDDITSCLLQPGLVPPYKQNSEGKSSCFGTLAIVTFEKVFAGEWPVLVAAYCCLFSLRSNTVISYTKKLIRPARTVQFDTEKTLIITEELYQKKAVLFSEFEEHLKEATLSQDLGHFVLACLSDSECGTMLQQSADKPPSAFFSKWINLYKYFTNQLADTEDNLAALYSHSRRELPGKSPTDSSADYSLRMVVSYMLSTLNSHPRMFQSIDLTFGESH